MGKDARLRQKILDTSLAYPEFLRQIGELAAHHFSSVAKNTSWLLVEHPNLPPELQEELHEYLRQGHAVLVSALEHYLPDTAEAGAVAWMLFCTFFGYQEIKSAYRARTRRGIKPA